jgi:hypothetical protein
VPYPGLTTFWELVRLGGELRQLHLLESPVVSNPITKYPMDGENTVTRKINQNDFILRPAEDRINAVHGNSVRPEPVEGQADVVHGTTSSPRTAKKLTETFGRIWINDTQYFDGVTASQGFLHRWLPTGAKVA